MASLLVARSLAGDWTRWRVTCKVASCNPRLGHTALCRTALDEWSARRRDLYQQRTTLTRHRLPCPGGILTHNLSKRVVAYLRLRPRGHRGRLLRHLLDENTVRDSDLERHCAITRNVCPPAMCDVRIWRKEDGLWMRIYNARKCVLYESRGPPSISLSALWIFATKKIIHVIRLVPALPTIPPIVTQPVANTYASCKHTI
jgi:hypothetical protein